MGDSSALVGLHGSFLAFVLLLTLSSVRLFVMFLILPAMSSEIIPGAARNGVVYVFGSFIAYGQPANAIDITQIDKLIMLMGKEAFIGMLLGFAASTVFWITQNIGTVIDDVAGFNAVQMNNPLRMEQSTPVSNTLLQFAIAAFFSLGGMITLLGVVFESFTVWPLLQIEPHVHFLLEPFVLQRTDSMMMLSVKLSAPIVLLLVLVDLAAGLVARNADRLEPSNLSQPIRGALALILLCLLLQVFFTQVQGALSFETFRSEINGLMQR